MIVIRTIGEMQKFSTDARKKGLAVGVVPTMGFLHEGHLSLVDEARKRAGVVIVTIFVNPTQFAPNEDLDKYPRDFERDSRLCEERGVDAIFAPSPSEMYLPDASTWVAEERLSQGLCAKTRPTHFRGVTTVVAKLFNATLPDVAVFGQKDAQQARVIRRMARDLNFPVEIVVAPLVREPDGLAMSSRNKYLSADERKRALAISSSLFAARDKISSGSFRDVSDALAFVRGGIEAAGGVVDYAEAVDPDTLEPKAALSCGVMLVVAAFFGKTRLLDNVVV